MALVKLPEIGLGSKGKDLEKLQLDLNKNGQNLAVDGILGTMPQNAVNNLAKPSATQNAVNNYQGSNGLAIDGIVGNNTWGQLLSKEQTSATQNAVNNLAKPSPTTTNKTNSYSSIDLSKYDSGYKESDDVIAANKKKSEAENAVSQYGDFSYSNQDTFNAIMNKILNREKFSYDLNGDALYQQYKDKYIQQGKMAMQDTMGQAAAMTGGYGNSYAATVGNQAYQASLENLNDIVPELYQMAYDRYIQEGQDMLNQYSMLADDRNTEYGMWSDKYNKLVSDRDYYGNEANNAYAKDYGEWYDNYARDFDRYWQETNYGYQQNRDKIADEQWQTQFDEGVRQYDESMSEEKRQYDESMSEEKRQYDESMSFNREQYEYQKAQAEKAQEEEDAESYEEDAEQYADWGAGDWNDYFAQIRQSEGKEAAEAELNYFIKNGLIPQNMISYGALGARGSLGH